MSKSDKIEIALRIFQIVVYLTMAIIFIYLTY